MNTNNNHHGRKINVGVLFGGRSGEHDVSLNSAQSVINALDRAKYNIIPIGIQRNGHWISGTTPAALAEGITQSQLPAKSKPALLPRHDAELARLSHIDVVLPILHGPYGEDGTVQGLLELADIPYVGAGVAGSAVAMDKAIFKNMMTAHHIPILAWELVLRSTWQHNAAAVIDQLETALTYPMFTKPANLGSSVGISKCTNRAELVAGLDEAAAHDRRIVVEQGCDARELEVSILGNEQPKASVVGEIRPAHDFYDYDAKYISDDSELIIPADLTVAQSDSIRALAIQAYVAIDCAGMGRVDFLMDRQSGAIYLNEINTIPGFTNISMYPKLWAASGLPYSKLLDELITLAVERHAQKSTTHNKVKTTL